MTSSQLPVVDLTPELAEMVTIYAVQILVALLVAVIAVLPWFIRAAHE